MPRPSAYSFERGIAHNGRWRLADLARTRFSQHQPILTNGQPGPVPVDVDHLSQLPHPQLTLLADLLTLLTQLAPVS